MNATYRFRPLLAITGLVLCLLAGMPTRVTTQQPTQPLSATDVTAVLAAAFLAVPDPTMAAAVVDRRGVILGVASRSGASALAPDQAVTIARTAGFFSNGQAPLATRTIRFISGIHFPPGVPNTPNAALYGIETSNRGCELIAGQPDIPWPRSRSIRGLGLLPGLPAQACNSLDSSGCAIGDLITGPPFNNGPPAATRNVGINTGKNDFLDIARGPLDTTVNPSGFALYRNGQVLGAVGVSGVAPERAEYAAIVGAVAAQDSLGIFAAPFEPIPTPGAVFIDGIRLPFFSDCISIQCIRDRVELGPPGGGRGFTREQAAAIVRDILQGNINPLSAYAFSFIVPPRPSIITPGLGFTSAETPLPTANTITPEGYLIRQGNPNSLLTDADVARIIDQAVARANVTRAQVRIPLGQTAKVIITVTDADGVIRGHYRMQDGLADAVDVVPAKARNAYYFSTPEGYQVLLDYVRRSPFGYEWEPSPPGGSWAITTRTLGFGGNPLFPPGIDLEEPPTPGPWFDLFLYDSTNPCTEGSGPSRGGNRNFRNQNGMVWFAGSSALFKNGVLVGGLGVSGDGIDQNDYITAGGAQGFEPPPERRVDRSFFVTEEGKQVRLPYLKFPRNPERR